MTDKELASALFQAGLLTQEQIREAAQARTANQGFAQIVVARGWLSPDQIRAIDPGALLVAPTAFTPPTPPFTPPPATPPPFSQPPPAPPSAAPHTQPFPQAPPIPEPQAPPRFTPTTIYEPFDSTRLVVYSLFGMLCCQCIGILVVIQSVDALGKIKAGRIDPAHQSKIIIALILSAFGIVVTMVWRAYMRANRGSSPF
jgi:hypothetical protein